MDDLKIQLYDHSMGGQFVAKALLINQCDTDDPSTDSNQAV